jgi:hypothetical protein
MKSMIDLDRALNDIRTMRSQLARGAAFRGYGPATMALTGFLALAVAYVQAQLLPSVAGHVAAWVGLWVATAVVSVGLIGFEMVRRARVVHGGLADEMIQAAALQLLPAAAAGGLLTLVLWQAAPTNLWMLPGLWQIVLSLGVFAACSTLPASMQLVAFWYLGSGLACLAFGSGVRAFSPWQMGAPFGVGDVLAAFLIFLAGRNENG